MKVVTDLTLCAGYANCVLADDQVFDIDDDGKVKVLVEQPDPSQRASVEEAVRNCPVAAISIVD